jgi:hypothetical protein
VVRHLEEADLLRAVDFFGDRRRVRLAVAIPTSLTLATAVVWHPDGAVAAAGCVLSLAVGALPGPAPARSVLTLVGVLLVGYAFCGRGFAYLGLPPIYIGEMVLVSVCAMSLAARMLRSPFSVLKPTLTAFLVWAVIRTLPGVWNYGLDALRDAAIWGYAAFALVVGAALRGLHETRLVARWYSGLLGPLLTWYCLVALIRVFNPGFAFPEGAAGIPIVVVKPGDVAVHLAGIAAFLALQLHRPWPAERVQAWKPEWPIWMLWSVCVLFYGSQNRGGLLGLTLALLFLAIVLRKGKWGKAVGPGLLTIVISTGWKPDFSANYQREVTPRQIVENLKSVAGSDNPQFEGTRRWRLAWWRKIVDYTLYGPYFWSGKGFGPNLADEDGFQVTRDRRLRSPHNGHLAILARAGVPAFALWIAFLLTHGLALMKGARAFRIAGDFFHSRMLLWVLAYWLAATINGASDVYLEGPQGGIWFWCLVGLGLGILSICSTTADASATRIGFEYTQPRRLDELHRL